MAELVRMEVRAGEVGGSIPAKTRFWKNTDKSGEQGEGCHEGTDYTIVYDVEPGSPDMSQHEKVPWDGERE